MSELFELERSREIAMLRVWFGHILAQGLEPFGEGKPVSFEIINVAVFEDLFQATPMLQNHVCQALVFVNQYFAHQFDIPQVVVLVQKCFWSLRY